MEKKINNDAGAGAGAAAAAALPKLERAVSIEEPKTLTEAELTFFREAALKVIKTHTPEEATRIFLGKLETPVGPAKQIEPAAIIDN